MKNLYFLLLLSVLFIQCGDKETIIMNYDLTYCADKWQLDHNASLEQQEEVIEVYLDDEQDIFLERITILENVNPAQVCNACSCKTGDVVEVKIDEVFELKLGALGFYR